MAFLTGTSFRKHFGEDTAKMFYRQIRCSLLHQTEAQDSQVKRQERIDRIDRKRQTISPGLWNTQSRGLHAAIGSSADSPASPHRMCQAGPAIWLGGDSRVIPDEPGTASVNLN